MRIALIGASGLIGSALLEEAGKFRPDGGSLPVDAEGDSRIRVQDHAVVTIDEPQEARHENRRFTVAC